MTDINVAFDQPQINVTFPATASTAVHRGDIIGVLADQADLVAALSLRMLKSANLSDLTNVVTARSNLGLVIGTDVQAQNANLSAIAGLTSAADKVAYFTGAGTAALADFTSFGRSIVAAANSAAVCALLGLVIGSTVQAYDANTTILGNTTTGTGAIVRDVSPTLTAPNIGAAVATSITASGSGGFLVESNSGTDIALFGAGGGSNATFYGGVSLSTFTQGSIVFAGSSGLLSQDNSRFYFDDTNNRVGLLTTAPTHTLTLGSTSTGIALYNTADQTTNYESLSLSRSSNTAIIGINKAGTGSIRTLRISGQSAVTLSLTNTAPYIVSNVSSSVASTSGLMGFTGNVTNSGGTAVFVSVAPTINQSSTSGFTGLLINPTLITQGSGLQLLQDWQASSVSQAVMTTTGLLGIKTTAPTHSITLGSTATGIALYNTADQVTNFERIRHYVSGNVFYVISESGGTGTSRDIGIGSNTNGVSGTPGTRTQWNSDTITHNLRATSGVAVSHIIAAGSNTASSGVLTVSKVNATINQSGSAGYTILDLNPTITTEGSGAKNFILCRKASGTTLFGVDSNGGLIANRAIVPSGTTTPVTIAAGGTNKVYTNEGATAKITYNLPAAVAGLTYTFIVHDVDGMDVTAAAGDTIRRNTNVTATGGTVTSTAIGSVLVLVAINATEWIATSEIGTWA